MAVYVTSENDKENKIVNYVLEKVGEKLNDRNHIFYVITIDGGIYDLNTYEQLTKEGSNTLKAYIIIVNLWFEYDSVLYYCPFIGVKDIVTTVYFLKHYDESSFGGLKYITLISHFPSINETVIEITDLDSISKFLDAFELKNMPSEEEDLDGGKRKIKESFLKLRLFDVYDFQAEQRIIRKYYNEKDDSLAKDVINVMKHYYHVFRPSRITLSSNP